MRRNSQGYTEQQIYRALVNVSGYDTDEAAEAAFNMCSGALHDKPEAAELTEGEQRFLLRDCVAHLPRGAALFRC